MTFDGRLYQYWEAVALNSGRARRRALPPQCTEDQVNMDPITLDGGAIMHVPSDDEDPPAPPSGTHALFPPPGAAGSSSDSEDDPAHRRG